MKKALKWSALGLAGLIAIVLAAATILNFLGSARLNNSYTVSTTAIEIPSDSVSLERGRHLAHNITLCVGCHGDSLSGSILFEDPSIATIYASNLTAGRGGVGSTYSDSDFVRAIRHGVDKQGRGLMIMHSDHYNHLGKDDLAAIIAYVRSVQPVDHVVPVTTTALMGRIFVAMGLFDTEAMPLIAAEVIDHDAPIPDSPLPDTTAEYGEYLTSIALCTMCHGGDFNGGPPIEEGAPPGPSLLSYAVEGGWSEAQFIETIRSGVTPSGRSLDGEVMPWEIYGRMTDMELMAIHRYLESLVGS